MPTTWSRGYFSGRTRASSAWISGRPPMKPTRTDSSWSRVSSGPMRSLPARRGQSTPLTALARLAIGAPSMRYSISTCPRASASSRVPRQRPPSPKWWMWSRFTETTSRGGPSTTLVARRTIVSRASSAFIASTGEPPTDNRRRGGSTRSGGLPVEVEVQCAHWTSPALPTAAGVGRAGGRERAGVPEAEVIDSHTPSSGHQRVLAARTTACVCRWR